MTLYSYSPDLRPGQRDAMVQIADHARWRDPDSSAEPPADVDLKWRPGMTAAEARHRAKEMRKAVEIRGERREMLRNKAKETKSPQSGYAAGDTPTPRGEEIRHSTHSPMTSHKPGAVLQRLLWREDGAEDVAVWLLRPDASTRWWCRQYCRTGSCRFGANCRHAHETSLEPYGLSPGRGASMPPLERAPDPHALGADDMRHIAFVVAEGVVCYDFEDPDTASRFMRPTCALDANDGPLDDGDDQDAARAPPLPAEVWSPILGRC